MPRKGPRYSEEEAKAAVAASLCYTEVLRRLGMRAAGGNHRTIRKYVEDIWRIPTDHFDPDVARRAPGPRVPLALVLVEGSGYQRRALKRRLYEVGLKQRCCELCGQGEIWNGRRMSLILDHVNGVWNDNRLENLRIVCPNCNATLDTHCGKLLRKPRERGSCELCGAEFEKKYRRQRFCSRRCGVRRTSAAHRRVERPPYERLMSEIEETSYLAVGRKYGVSDNAIRKWVRAYERERRVVRL
jgi:hypothetical protein